MKTTITKRIEFCYGHFLPGYQGKCANVHGHNSFLEVTISRTSGQPSYQGMVVDFGELKGILSEVVEQLDHKLINDLLPIPTAENIAIWIFNQIDSRLKEALPGVQVEKIKVSETSNSWAEVTR